MKTALRLKAMCKMWLEMRKNLYGLIRFLQTYYGWNDMPKLDRLMRTSG